MKIIALCSLLIVFLPACHKNNPDKNENRSAVCFQPVVINTNLPDNLLSVFFINEKDGFVTGENGGIYKTLDAGTTWTKLPSAGSLPVRCISFLDHDKGFVAGGENSCAGTGCTPAGGFILGTQDGGQSWTKVFIPSAKIELSSICFINSTTGFCVGDNAIITTTDAGKTWTEKTINNIGGKMMKVFFADSLHGIIVCLYDTIITTSDGGLSWQINSPGRHTGYYASASAEGVDYVSGQGKVLKSINNGRSWSELSNSPADIFDIHFTNRNIGYAFGRGNYSGGDFGRFYGSMYCTDNGGTTWNGNGGVTEVGTIQAVSFPTRTVGYAISGKQIIRISVN